MKIWGCRQASESGSAMIMSIMVLAVLSALGITLMLTTSTESDIAVNQRWGEMAFFNADAALEYGKNILAAYATQDGDFRNAMPPARGPGALSAPPVDSLACSDPTQPGCRDYQYSRVEFNGTVYIGRILRDLNGRPVQFDFRQPTGSDTRGDIDDDGSVDVQGAVTLWVRRAIVGDEDYGFTDDKHDQVILTAEGVAPNYEGFGMNRNVSMRRLEMVIEAPPVDPSGDKHADALTGSDAGPGGSNAGSAGTISTTLQ